MSEENFRINGTEENQSFSKQDLENWYQERMSKDKKDESSVSNSSLEELVIKTSNLVNGSEFFRTYVSLLSELLTSKTKGDFRPAYLDDRPNEVQTQEDRDKKVEKLLETRFKDFEKYVKIVNEVLEQVRKSIT
jgi:hypothetical protein